MTTHPAPTAPPGDGLATHSEINLRENSIDFLRLVFAAAVIVAHSYGLGGFKVGPVGKMLDTPGFGGFAVFGFFFLSGFLVTRSYLGTASVWRYLWHRCLRIFPGFWCCLLVTVFVVGPIVCLKEGGTLSAYFQRGVPNSAAHYIQANFWLKMHQYRIRDLLAHAHSPYTFDGALWTLRNEFLCYLYVAGLGVSGILRRARAIPLLIAIGLLALSLAAMAAPGPARAVYAHLFNHTYDKSVSQMIYFFLGSAAYLYRDRLVLNRYLALGAFVLFAFSFVHTTPHAGLHPALVAAHPEPSDLSHRIGEALMPVTFSYCVFWLAFRLPIRRFARHGDLSYGTYIYAFPMQQLLALYGLNRWGMPVYVVMVLASTLPIAFLSWRLVEKPCLTLKRLAWPSPYAGDAQQGQPDSQSRLGQTSTTSGIAKPDPKNISVTTDQRVSRREMLRQALGMAAGTAAAGPLYTSRAGFALAGLLGAEGGVHPAVGPAAPGAGNQMRRVVGSRMAPGAVRVDPTVRYQTVEGWGTSLAWWANVIGGWSDATRNAIADLVFNPLTGLGLNVVRYNIGGGDDPAHDHMRPGAAVPGYQPAPGVWDWNADANQRWILLAARARGATAFEAFSNSPPYWMTRSGCASGSDDGSNNLNDADVDRFAHYLAEVVAHFRTNWGLTFQTIEPFNEPSISNWRRFHNQEGCHTSRAQQRAVIARLGAQLAARGVTDTTIAAADEYSTNDAVKTLDAYERTALAHVARINTHSYSGTRGIDLRARAAAAGKGLWMTEFGPAADPTTTTG